MLAASGSQGRVSHALHFSWRLSRPGSLRSPPPDRLGLGRLQQQDQRYTPPKVRSILINIRMIRHHTDQLGPGKSKIPTNYLFG